MKTKNIFKTLAAAMLMPAMLLTTACSNEDDPLNNTAENTAKKGYILPVTVSVTRQGDDATTRATFNGETKKLEFSEGDQLFVKGWDGGDGDGVEIEEGRAGSFAGVLTWVSDGTFSGTIATENKYSGTIDDLFASAYAYLLPNGYGSYGYLSVPENPDYDAEITSNNAKAFALTKAAAVEQLSKEWAYGYSSGFVLEPNNAILNFTISGLAASTEVAVVFSIYDYGELYGTITGNVTTDASGTATFAIGVEGGPDLNDCTLTVDGNDITLVSSSKEVEAGKIYNINRSVAPAGPTAYTLAEATVGLIVGTDGNAYAVADKNNLPSGVTAVGMVAYKNGSSGLVIALKDECDGAWSYAKSACEGKTAVGGHSWHLPSVDEWKQIFKANGGSESSFTGLEDAVNAAGGNVGYMEQYWTSTEARNNAYYVANDLGSVMILTDSKSEEHFVYAVFAF